MSKVPSLFNEYFKTKINELCNNIKNETDKIINVIPNLHNQSQIHSHTNKLYELFNSTKKELDVNFELLFIMTHLSEDEKDDGFKIVTRKKNRKNKNP